MATVTIGSLIGMGLQSVFPPNIQTIIFQAIGLATLLLGIKMALKVPDGYLLVLIFSLIIGGVIGEAIQLNYWLQNMGELIKEGLHIQESQFTEGLLTAFLLFCVGSMTIVGAIEEGLEGKRELLLIKSTLDGISAIAFASTYGIGVLFSIVPMLIVQGGITIFAQRLKHFFTDIMLNQLNAVGGLLIIGIGIRLLNLGEINVENLLPSLLIVGVLTYFYERYLEKK